MRLFTIVCLALVATGCSGDVSPREQSIKKMEELNAREKKAQEEQARLAQYRARQPAAPTPSPSSQPQKKVVLERRPPAQAQPLFSGFGMAPVPKKSPAQVVKEGARKSLETKVASLELKKLRLENDLKRLRQKDSDYDDAKAALRRLAQRESDLKRKNEEEYRKFIAAGAERWKIRGSAWLVEHHAKQEATILASMTAIPDVREKAQEELGRKIKKVEREIEMAKSNIQALH